MSDSSGKASTTFAGDSSPHSGGNEKAAGAFGVLALIVALPIALLTAAITYGCFTIGRISHKVLWAIVGIYALGIAVTGNSLVIVRNYIQSWHMILDLSSIGDQSSIQAEIIHALILQIPLSILLGGIAGAAYAYWRWIRRASWEVFNFRRTPYQYFMTKKNISDIQSDKNSPKDGKTVGIESTYGHKIIQTDAESRAHTLVVGSTGAGKTTTLMLMARDIIKRGHGLIFVDLKGSPDVVRILHEYAERYGRDFQHWIMQTPGEEYEGPDPKGPAYYDPLNRGDASRRTNLIMAGREWSESYYEVLAQDYLQRAFEVAIATPPSNAVSSFSDIASLFDVNNLRDRAKILELKGNRRQQDILRQIDQYFNADGSVKKDSGTESALKSVEAEIRILTNSTAGAWLRKDPDGDNDINLRSVADNGSIVVFSLDALNYESDANRIGNLIIQDLKTVTSELQNKPAENVLQVYIDEFSAIDSENIVGLINKSRAANVPVTLSTQAIDDLRKESDSFMGRVVANINSFIVHRANDYDDAEEYAKLTGKIKVKEFVQQVEHATTIFGKIGKGAGTGKGSLTEVEAYRVSPSTIQELGTGEAIYIAKSPLRFEKVTVIPEDESKIVVDEVAKRKNLDERKQNNTPKPYQSFSSFTSDNSPEWEEEEIKPVEASIPDDYLPTYDIKPADKNNLDRIFNKSAKPESSKSVLDLTKSEQPQELPAPVVEVKPTVGIPASKGLPNKLPTTLSPAPKAPVLNTVPSLPTKPAQMAPRPPATPAIPVRPKLPTAIPATRPVLKAGSEKKENHASDIIKPSVSSTKNKSISGDWDDE